MRILIVSLYWPPAGGPGVQRPLKLAGHLAALGNEVHVLAPDDPKWLHTDPSQRAPDGVVVHRARNLGPRARRPAEELRAARGLARVRVRAAVVARGLLVPDASVLWTLTAIPAAVRLVRRHDVDVVVTTSPPGSVHFVGAVAARRTGVAWVADLRDSLVSHAHRSREIRGERRVASLVARRAGGISCASQTIAEETAGLGRARVPIRVIGNGCDFDDFAGLSYVAGARFRITHTGSFMGRRDPRPFLDALATVDGVVARFVGDFRIRDREHAAMLGLSQQLELLPYLPHDESLRCQRDSEALLLLIPHAGGRGRGVLSGKVFEYLAARRPILAAVPPDGEAAALLRETGAGMVVDPEDPAAIAAVLRDLRDRHRAGGLPDVELPPEQRVRLDRRTRADEFAALLAEVATR